MALISQCFPASWRMLAYRLPWSSEWLPCLRLQIHLTFQGAVILMATAVNVRARRLYSTSPKAALLRIAAFSAMITPVAALSFAIVLFGSIYQVFGVCNSCWCLSPVTFYIRLADFEWAQLLDGSVSAPWCRTIAHNM